MGVLIEVNLAGHTFLDPSVDVALPITQVATDSEPCWALSAVPPGVEGGNWYFQIGGEVLDREQWIEGAHRSTVHDDPVSGVPNRCQRASKKNPELEQEVVTGKFMAQCHFDFARGIGGFLTGLRTLG